MWGLNIKLACDIHDHAYEVGQTEDDKVAADYNLEFNCKKIIDYHTPKWNKVLRKLRYRRAESYHEMVHMCGSHSFWAKKLEQKRFA